MLSVRVWKVTRVREVEREHGNKEVMVVERKGVASREEVERSAETIEDVNCFWYPLLKIELRMKVI